MIATKIVLFHTKSCVLNDIYLLGSPCGTHMATSWTGWSMVLHSSYHRSSSSAWDSRSLSRTDGSEIIERFSHSIVYNSFYLLHITTRYTSCVVVVNVFNQATELLMRPWDAKRLHNMGKAWARVKAPPVSTKSPIHGRKSRVVVHTQKYRVVCHLPEL